MKNKKLNKKLNKIIELLEELAETKELTPIPPIFPKPDIGRQDSCPKCGISLEGVMGYWCSRADCPTGLGGVHCHTTSDRFKDVRLWNDPTDRICFGYTISGRIDD